MQGQEAERQMQRQLHAECRRSWKLRGRAHRKEGEDMAADAPDHWERCAQTSAEASRVAVALQSRFEELTLGRAERRQQQGYVS